VIASHGGDSSAVAEIKAGGPFKMSVAYFPDRYGQSLLPIIEGILAGEQVASIHGTPHVYLDITNVNEHYPG
jgi:ribose transport system substrate-binding protein